MGKRPFGRGLTASLAPQEADETSDRPNVKPSTRMNPRSQGADMPTTVLMPGAVGMARLGP